ncbi:MAG TPA: hypothetical protein PKM11_05895 [Methanomassiliicoccales archaeon]|nr:hypothetical protein [Methanomassiliicoccales archaeon]
MGVRYGLFNHTKKEFVVPEKIPVDAADPTTYPFANFISYLMMESWRYDHVAIMDDSKDFDCQRMFGSQYKDRSGELWNEFIMIMGWQFKDLRSI